MKFKIYKFRTVTSTNDIAINFIKRKKRQKGCIYARSQTKGRGTHGRKWISNKGNLFSSIFFPLKENFPPFNEFSIINPIIISGIIKTFCKNKKISIKWPNDVLINGKKISGILQEIITYKNTKYLIVGIGLNVISNPKIDARYKTTNLLIETKKKISIKKIIMLITSSYENFFLHSFE